MLRIRFDLSEQVKIEEEPRFNIAPTDPVLAIRQGGEGERDLGRLRWGLVPPGKTPKEVGRPLINLRDDSIRKGSFKSIFEERRCLVPANGFYEWRKTEEGKIPTWISLPGQELFSFAGMWSESKDDAGDAITSCTIITTEPTDQIRPIHNRMPVILPKEVEATWLSPDAEASDLHELLRPGPEGLEIKEVVDLVNNVREDGPELLDPHEPPAKLF